MSRVRVVRDEDGPVQGASPQSRRQNVPPPPHRNGRGPRRFRFTYEDYARLYGVKVDTVRHWVWLGRFNPESLQSVVDYAMQRRAKRQ